MGFQLVALAVRRVEAQQQKHTTVDPMVLQLSVTKTSVNGFLLYFGVIDVPKVHRVLAFPGILASIHLSTYTRPLNAAARQHGRTV